MVKRLDRLGINFACMQNADESGNEWTQVEQTWPQRHQGEHFDVGLSRGYFWGFRGLIFHQNSGNAMIFRENKLK